MPRETISRFSLNPIRAAIRPNLRQATAGATEVPVTVEITAAETIPAEIPGTSVIDMKGITGKKPLKKGVTIFLVAAAACVILGVLLSRLIGNGDGTVVGERGKISIEDEYIGRLDISGTISESEGGGLLESDSYHHRWLLDRIEDMKSDGKNKGMILFVNTPGGSVYASDEMYLAIQDYRKKTGRPVYSYMASQATSGGYYISAPCDRIVANRNCWTGSIGVTMGTMYDVTEMLRKMGVRTVTITSGKNKAMGSPTTAMTSRQKKIMQSLVDEAYDQFVDIVADGRKLSRTAVRKIADGRLYTAKQAKARGLVDQIGTLQDAERDMKARFHLRGCKVEEISYDDNHGIISRLFGETVKRVFSSGIGGKSDIDRLKMLLEANQGFTVTYLSPTKR